MVLERGRESGRSNLHDTVMYGNRSSTGCEMNVERRADDYSFKLSGGDEERTVLIGLHLEESFSAQEPDTTRSSFVDDIKRAIGTKMNDATVLKLKSPRFADAARIIGLEIELDEGEGYE
jgi:hypothetical protein